MPFAILVVDDDKDYLEQISEALDDYTVITASSAKEALEILRKPNLIEIVLLDVMMPDMRGTEVLKSIKTINKDTYVIMLTGHGSKDVVVEALRGDADEYMEKPVKIEKLRKLIEEVITARIRNYDPMNFIENIKYFLQKNYDRQVNLNDAAEIFYLSPKYLSRIFKEKTGIGFNSYKLQIKLEKAKELLTNTDATVSEVAYKLGYVNVESFIRFFKKYEKTTPTRYRNTINQ
ncbi:MAG: response regulator [Spirochaetia bacterium]